MPENTVLTSNLIWRQKPMKGQKEDSMCVDQLPVLIENVYDRKMNCTRVMGIHIREKTNAASFIAAFLATGYDGGNNI